MNIKEKTYNIYLWDTIGQERLKSLTKLFFKNAKIVILVYDITSKQSFKNLENWIHDCKEVLGNTFVIGAKKHHGVIMMKKDNLLRCLSFKTISFFA